ncbi:hypothetical protein PTTG_03743 [Puccinia triticina 1-1 BBBD Race 1]|uniref:Uncharacterized protein n=1 Tax=Puccinia triticina (isolate 1-1 / race 1 (BBBD)) TaxID=630390 RepID=A0A180GGA6_PUCT1|nr:hypothetical protein PTTG_03743 [Puccinia triticina 1-1 BBBD Race 1]
MFLDAYGAPSYQFDYCHGRRMKFVDEHLSSAAHLNAVRQNVMMNQLNIRQPEMVNTGPAVHHGPSHMDWDHSWPAQDSFNTEIQFPETMQPDYNIRDDDDVGFGSESSGVHHPPSDYSEEFLSWEMFGDSIIAQQAEAQNTPQVGGSPAVDWDPFKSEEDFMACLIMGYLHNLISRVTYLQLRIVLKMKKLVLPYWDVVLKARERTRALLNFVNQESISVWDNKIFTISVKGILTNELLNPYVTKHLEFYPHVPCGDPIDGLCQSFKWREDLLWDVWVQMVYNGPKHYYIYEPTQLKSGDVVIPTYFYKAKGKLYAKCCVPEYEPNGTGEEFDIIIPAHVKFNDTDNQRVVDILDFDKVYSKISEIVAEDGRKLPIKCGKNLYEEDKSGQKLPIDLPNPVQSGIQFSISDPIIEEINDMRVNGHFAYDSLLNQKVLIMSIVLVALGDSPMHAEMTSTSMPANANSPCCMCQLSVAKKEDKSLVDYVKDFLGLTTGGNVLEIIQYLLRNFMDGLSEGDRRTVEGNWKSLNKDALNIPSLRAVFMVTNYNSFIGKHMKIVIQAAPPSKHFTDVFKFNKEVQKLMGIDLSEPIRYPILYNGVVATARREWSYPTKVPVGKSPLNKVDIGFKY